MALAKAGGRIADRLAWVFASGYQAAVRCCFPEFTPLPGSWTCFATAEPRALPGCALEETADGYRLEGNKSWVAGASVVERMVVTIGDGESRRFVDVPRNAQGVEIVLPRKPEFLTELTQGTVHFSHVAVASESVVSGFARTQRFRGAEPLFVLSALTACLAAHAKCVNPQHPLLETADVVEARASELVDVLDHKEEIVPGLKALRADVRALLDGADSLIAKAPVLADSWSRDQRLLQMFGISPQPRQ
ncbi:MAG: hypothetical protein AAF458_00980 [Pseudomonadota bacterium]